MRAFAPEQKAALPAGPFAARPQAPGAFAHDLAAASSDFAHDFSRTPLRAKARTAAPPELVVAPPGDAYEREADRAADAVMAGGLPGAARSFFPPVLRRCACGGTCAACRAERGTVPDEETLHRREARGGGTPSIAPPAVHRVLASPGRPLEMRTRGFMEERFGADFSGVRVHTDASAAASARAVGALAYAVGNDVVFGAGRYAPGTSAGDRLLAHELAHVLQQRTRTDSLIQRLSDRDCDEVMSLPLSGNCRTGFLNTCYSETFIPASNSRLNVEVTVDYASSPGPFVEGREDFSVQVFKCGSFWGSMWTTDIGKKRVSRTLPDTLSFGINRVTQGDKYFIRIYSRSDQPLTGTYTIWQ